MKYFLPGILHILDQKERAKLFLLTFFDVIISALDIAFLGLTVLVVNFYIKGTGLPRFSFLPAQFTDKDSVLLIAVLFVLTGIKNAAAYFLAASKYRFTYSVASRLSERNMRNYLRCNYLDYVHIDSATHIRKISQQPIEFSTYILTNLQQLITQGVLVLFTVCAVLLYHASLFVMLFLLLLPAVALLGWLLKKKFKQVRANIKKTSENTLKNLRESLAGYIESNIYEKEDFFTGRYSEQQNLLNQNIRTQQTLQALPSRFIEVFIIFGFFILIVINKWSAHQASIDLLTIGVFMVAAYKIIPGVVQILNSAGQMKTYEFTIHDLRAADNEAENLAGRSAEQLISIKFDKIDFRYNDRLVLHHLSLEIHPGDFIGISGHSGRGKTTLINILLGFIEQQAGTVIINNKIADSTDRKNQRSRVSYVKQQSFLIHDTVLKNITLQETGHDAVRLNEVIAFCGLDALLDQYPHGSDLVITENGKNLSGGQRQRIILARALYHDFDLLILDEPFGELDQPTENALLEKLQLLASGGKMILFITHNKSSLAFCNQLISFDE